ncbi:PAS domain-containing protein [Rhizobium sp. FKL33]|uniref:PAS domain-containing protein n=1 Tax=Rhizobium sp. FKL33 TaxID=2562307 RepID=UPI0010C07163|nr:PAS domain-containing protein [Rhizobium sp. FKL33]
MSETIGPDQGLRSVGALDLPPGLEASALLRTLLFASNDCVKLLDLDGRLLFMSEGGRRVMEVDDFQAIQHCPWPDFWNGDERRAAADAVAAGRDNKASRFRGYTGTAKGTMKYWDVQVLPVLDDSGRPSHLLSISRDVSELRSADLEIVRLIEEARQSERRFRLLADVMPQMVWSTLPDGYHDYYNARWYEFTGMADGSTDGEGWNALFHPDDQERAWATWRRSLASGEPYEIEYRLKHHSGDYRWVLGRALPLRGADGTIDRWYGTCTDIHAAKETSENLALLSQELSHRIKNIFAIINGLIGQSARWYPESKAFASDVQQRLAALGRAHDFVRPHSEASLSMLPTIRNLLREILRPYRALEENRIQIDGDDVAIDDRAATPLALVFHELATNAAKYGALSTLEGRVNIALSTQGDVCRIAWLEQGGPRIDEEPQHRGFGTKLSAVSVEGQLGGSLSRRWLPEGLAVEIECPASSFSRT